jgi:hypothetical protein
MLIKLFIYISRYTYIYILVLRALFTTSPKGPTKIEPALLFVDLAMQDINAWQMHVHSHVLSLYLVMLYVWRHVSHGL